MKTVQESAVAQLKEVLRMIESGERAVRRINTTFYKNDVEGIAIDLEVAEEEAES